MCCYVYIFIYRRVNRAAQRTREQNVKVKWPWVCTVGTSLALATARENYLQLSSTMSFLCSFFSSLVLFPLGSALFVSLSLSLLSYFFSSFFCFFFFAPRAFLCFFFVLRHCSISLQVHFANFNGTSDRSPRVFLQLSARTLTAPPNARYISLTFFRIFSSYCYKLQILLQRGGKKIGTLINSRRFIPGKQLFFSRFTSLCTQLRKRRFYTIVL